MGLIVLSNTLRKVTHFPVHFMNILMYTKFTYSYNLNNYKLICIHIVTYIIFP